MEFLRLVKHFLFSPFRLACGVPETEPKTVQFSSVSSGLKKDRTTEGRTLHVGLNYAGISFESLRIAREAACRAFAAQHGSYKVDRNRRLLMRRADDVNSTLSASHLSWRQLIPELTTAGSIFKDLPFKRQIAYMKTLQSTVRRSVIEARKEEVRGIFYQYIRYGQAEDEDELVSGYDKFLDRATEVLAGDFRRVARLFMNKWSAGTGFAAKLKPGSRSQIDPDAGIRSKTDFIIRYGHPYYGGKTLVADEAKFFEKRPNMARSWSDMKENHLPELMASLTGKLPTFAVATCNYGQKVFRVDTNETDGMSTIYQSPPGPCYLDFNDEGAWELAFEFWLEIAALAVLPEETPVLGDKRKLSARASDGPKSPRTPRKPSNSPETRSPKKTCLKVKTSTGGFVEFCSIDLETVFTSEELSQLQQTVEDERLEEEQRDEAIEGKFAYAEDLESTIEGTTPPFARNLG